MTQLIGIDPGKVTGWARISTDGPVISLVEFGQTKDTTLVEIIDHLKAADVVVYEGWWTRPDKSRTGAFDWKSMDAPQVIGSLLALCKVLEIPRIHKQQPSQKVPGYGFAGLKYVKGKQGTHWQDALAHAVFYAVTQLQCHPVGKPS